MPHRSPAVALALLAALATASPLPAQGDSVDTGRHQVRVVAVDDGVHLEVLDWGGTGRPVVLLAGGGRTAHDFDAFAPKVTDRYHVYGITRRGLGASSRPETGYGSDRLGDDVLAVIDSLRLRRPVVAGHSRAGAELSSIGSRHPERVAGLVYLDAGYGYAYYDTARGDPGLDMPAIQQKLERLQFGPAMTRRQMDSVITELVDHDFPLVARELRETRQRLAAVPDTTVLTQPAPEVGSVLQKMWAGARRYPTVRAPMLFLYAPLGCLAMDGPSAADDVRRLFPHARVRCLPNGEHDVYESNEAEVLGEVRAFIDGLPPSA